MTLLDRVKKLCDAQGISQGTMEKEIGLSNGASYKWKNSSPSMKVLEKLSKYFDVSVNYLMTGEEEPVLCKCCGYSYYPNVMESVDKHTFIHQNWSAMQERYGFQWTYEECKSNRIEAEKYIKFNQFSGDSLDTAHYAIFFKCRFWEYLSSRDFNINISFEVFRKTAILDKLDSNLITEESYNALCELYHIDPTYNFDYAINLANLTNQKEDGQSYYLTLETQKVAQEIFENDKVLFDVYRSSDKERLIEYAKRLKALREMEEGEI